MQGREFMNCAVIPMCLTRSEVFMYLLFIPGYGNVIHVVKVLLCSTVHDVGNLITVESSL
jgi:hypothetical protein